MNLIISKKVILQKLKISPNVAVYVEHRTLLNESLIWQILCQPLVYSFSRCLHKFLESGQNTACEMYNRHLDIAIGAWFTAIPCYGRVTASATTTYFEQQVYHDHIDGTSKWEPTQNIKLRAV